MENSQLYPTTIGYKNFSCTI